MMPRTKSKKSSKHQPKEDAILSSSEEEWEDVAENLQPEPEKDVQVLEYCRSDCRP